MVNSQILSDILIKALLWLFIIGLCIYLIYVQSKKTSSFVNSYTHETFQNQAPIVQDLADSPLYEHLPNGPSPTDLHDHKSYHLLSDTIPSSDAESLSKINSAGCYAADFEQSVSKLGNYRQTTNNYKRNYPDSCSGWNQELTANFYKTA